MDTTPYHGFLSNDHGILLQLILEALNDVVEYDLAVILKLVDKHTLGVEEARGPLSDPVLDTYRIDLRERTDVARVLRRREPTLFTAGDGHIDTYHEVIDLPGDHSCLVAPLFIQDEPLGMLTLDHKVCNKYSRSTVRFVDTVAKLISIIVAQSDSSRHLLSERSRLTEERNMLLRMDAGPFHDAIGNSPVWKSVLESARIVAGSDLSVLIQGETGTGKEQIARVVHRLSTRGHKRFVALNCSVLNPSLAESELFGHEKGAFTSANNRRKGRFELADGGTLFLDEIGDLPAELQPKLLRALQERRFERVGGERTITSDVRVIAASHVNLEQAVRRKTFREDLFYRLSVFPITLPPLRERGEDIVLLAEYFLQDLRKRRHYAGLHLSGQAVECLLGYSWPGNVRELQNVIRRSALVAGGNRIEPHHLALKQTCKLEEAGSAPEAGVPFHSPEPPSRVGPGNRGIEPLDVAMRAHIQKALDACKGKIYGDDGAAALLDMKPTTLQSRMKKLGIVR